MVAFSGGRDSSALLAVAAHVARREGLSPPVALTLRWPGIPSLDEGAWQELVVRHLALADWCRVDLDAELDLVGPLATDILVRHGLMWPPMGHLLSCLAQRAAGGSLLTGEGGDQLFAEHRFHPVVSLLAFGRRPLPSDATKFVMAVTPRVVREPVLRRRLTFPYPWLRPQAHRELARARAEIASMEPVGWGSYVAWRIRRSREELVWRWWARTLSGEHDVRYSEPMLDAEFVAALAARRGWRGYPDRDAAMDDLFGDLLPAQITHRATKVEFTPAYFGRFSRSFVADWQGDGLDGEVVDVDALRSTWEEAAPSPASWTLLQAAWLATHTTPGRGAPAASDGPPPGICNAR